MQMKLNPVTQHWSLEDLAPSEAAFLFRLVDGELAKFRGVSKCPDHRRHAELMILWGVLVEGGLREQLPVGPPSVTVHA